MANADRELWNEKYAQKSPLPPQPADIWLSAVAARLTQGRALDLACGLGHNAIWLGQLGWQVDAIDISEVGLALAAQTATGAGCSTVNWIAADLDTYVPSAASYDLVTVFRFLDRERLPTLIQSALRPEGHLVYETFTQDQCQRADNHLKSDRFTLRPGELPLLFPELIVEQYEEVELPDRSVARLLARKPDK